MDDWTRQQNVNTLDTLSSCSSSEVDDELVGRLYNLIEAEFSSDEDEEDKVPSATPPRRSLRLSLKPSDEVQGHVEQVRELHKRAVQKIMTRWKDNEYMVKIMSKIQRIDPRRELDRFASQVAREVTPVASFDEEKPLMKVTVDTELFDQIKQQL